MIDKVFVKKTRRGNILKIVREHYLRDDLSCGSESCLNSVCVQSFKGLKTLLEKDPVSTSLKYQKPHYIVPDTNIVLHQVCVYIYSSFKIILKNNFF
jgi:exosome complex exonuclease DIS3/RRP44